MEILTHSVEAKRLMTITFKSQHANTLCRFSENIDFRNMYIVLACTIKCLNMRKKNANEKFRTANFL